jgi:type VI secretion system protein ImpE
MSASQAANGPGALFKAGKLDEAVAAAGAAVKKTPGDLAARVLLAELLLFTGNYERTDVILDAATGIDPEAVIVVAEFRQLLRAEIARRQYWRDGRLPEFLGQPSETQRLLLAASVSMRAGDSAESHKLAQAAEAARPPAKVTIGGTSHEDFRDADDLCGGSLEVLTSTGKYYWVPIERVQSIDFHPAKRARDLFWRRATISVQAGPDGDVYIPVLYSPPTALDDDTLRLGRATDWVGEGDEPVRGIGQRIFLVGEEAMEIMSLETIEFEFKTSADRQDFAGERD